MLNLRVRVCVQARRNASASLESNAVCIGRLNMRTLILLTYLLPIGFLFLRLVLLFISFLLSCAWNSRGNCWWGCRRLATTRPPSPPCWVNFEFWVSVSLLFFLLRCTYSTSKQKSNKQENQNKTNKTNKKHPSQRSQLRSSITQNSQNPAPHAAMQH